MLFQLILSGHSKIALTIGVQEIDGLITTDDKIRDGVDYTAATELMRTVHLISRLGDSPGFVTKKPGLTPKRLMLARQFGLNQQHACPKIA